MRSDRSLQSLGVQFSELSACVTRLVTHLKENESDLMLARLPYGLDPSFVGNLMAVVRESNFLKETFPPTDKDIGSSYVAIAGVAGSLPPPWRFLYLANVLHFLGLSRGGPHRRLGW